MLSETKIVVALIADNCEYFGSQGEKFEALRTTLKNLSENIEKILPKVESVSVIAKEYDFDEATPANGFHSYVDIFTSAIKVIQEICYKLKISRSRKLFFSANNFDKYESSHKN